jgi:hypothetical protein
MASSRKKSALFLCFIDMVYQFTITYNSDPINVSGGEGSEYYELTFPDGEKRLIDYTSRGWRYVLPWRIDPAADEDELMSEESSIELGLEIEAEAIGALIYAKARELGLKG